VIAAVEWHILRDVVLASAAGGLGAAVAFSLVVIGATRSADMRREGHAVAAGVFVALAVVAFAAVIAGIVFGITILTNKS
jgi:hypothetical protein